MRWLSTELALDAKAADEREIRSDITGGHTETFWALDLSRSSSGRHKARKRLLCHASSAEHWKTKHLEPLSDTDKCLRPKRRSLPDFHAKLLRKVNVNLARLHVPVRIIYQDGR